GDRGRRPGSAPRVGARARAGLATRARASRVPAAATAGGREGRALPGATLALPMAANCLAAVPGEDGTHQVVRQRWAGLLLEDAHLDSSPALMTLATEAIPAAAVADPGGGSGTALTVHPYQPSLAEGGLPVRATGSRGAT